MTRHVTTALGVFLLFLGVYGATFHGYVDVEDLEVTYEATKNLVEEGSIAIGDGELGRRIVANGFYVVAGEDGRHWPIYPLAQILYEAPFYVLGKALTHEPSEAALRTAFSAPNVLAGALLCAVIYALVAVLGYTRRVAVATALLAGCGTMLWAYAQGVFADLPLALCTGLASLCVLRGRGRVGWLLAAGLCHGLAAALRPSGFLLLLPTLLVVRRAGGVRIACIVVPVVAVLAALGWLDAEVFGRPLAASYAGVIANAPPQLTFSYGLSLFGLLLSDGRGLFVLSPLLVLAVLGAPALRREHPAAATLALAQLAVLALFFAAFDGWYGGWCWGPRYLLPCVPMLCIGVAAWLAQAGSLRRALTIGFAAVSIWIQVLSVAVPHRAYIVTIASCPAEFTQFFFYTRFSPVLAHQKLLLRKVRGEPDVFSPRWLIGYPSDVEVDVTKVPSDSPSAFNGGFDHFAWVRVAKAGQLALLAAGLAGCAASLALGVLLLRRGAHPLPSAMRTPNSVEST